MSANKRGLQLEKHQIKALLAFTGDAEHGFDVVHFRVPEAGANLVANATDGHRGLEAIFETSDAHCVVGDWAVSASYLGDCLKLLKKGQHLLLRIEDGVLTEGVMLDGETLDEGRRIPCPVGEVSTQLTFDTIAKVMRIAQDARRLTGSWYAVQGRFHSDVAIVAKACGTKDAAVSVYPPPAPDQGIGFEARALGVTWRGVLMPMRVPGPGAQPPEPVDDPEGPDGESAEADDDEPGTGVGQAVREFHETLKQHGVTVVVTSGSDEGASP